MFQLLLQPIKFYLVSKMSSRIYLIGLALGWFRISAREYDGLRVAISHPEQPRFIYAIEMQLCKHLRENNIHKF